MYSYIVATLIECERMFASEASKKKKIRAVPLFRTFLRPCYRWCSMVLHDYTLAIAIHKTGTTSVWATHHPDGIYLLLHWILQQK